MNMLSPTLSEVIVTREGGRNVSVLRSDDTNVIHIANTNVSRNSCIFQFTNCIQQTRGHHYHKP